MKKLILFLSLLIIGCSNNSKSQKIDSINEEINYVQEEIENLRGEVMESKLILDDLKNQLIAEIGMGVGSGQAGDGPTAALIKDKIVIATEEFDSIGETNDKIIQELNYRVDILRDSIVKLLN